jgi:hypothetical protein
MKRKTDRPPTLSERRSLLLLTVFLLSATGLGVWLHLGDVEFCPRAEFSTHAGDDLRIPPAWNDHRPDEEL